MIENNEENIDGENEKGEDFSLLIKEFLKDTNLKEVMDSYNVSQTLNGDIENSTLGTLLGSLIGYAVGNISNMSGRK